MADHRILGLGIIGKLEEWLDDFLKDRSQAVVANGTTSAVFHRVIIIHSGLLRHVLCNSDIYLC